MSLARASWIAVVVICLATAAATAIAGYAGYAVTVLAVGLAASINLLPERTGPDDPVVPDDSAE